MEQDETKIENPNLSIYNQVREVPAEALKPITGGRLKGKSDITPMWRIKRLTELFGACGFGWYYDITEKRLEQGANGEIAGFVDIKLYVLDPNTKEWSKPIAGTGGNGFVRNEKSGYYTDDEVFKMALTDAISVACKALGIGADVYWAADRTKYDVMQDKALQEEINKCTKLSEITEIFNREKGKQGDQNKLIELCAARKKAIEVKPNTPVWEEVIGKFKAGALKDDICKEYYISKNNLEMLINQCV